MAEVRIKQAKSGIKVIDSLKSSIKKHHSKSPINVSVYQLFRFASRNQKILTLIGLLAALLNGVAMPLMLFLYGRTTDTFIITGFCDAYKYYNVSELCPPNIGEDNINQLYYQCNWTGTNITIPELSDSVSAQAIYFTIIGIFVWIVSWIQTTFLAYSCEKIVCDVRIRLFNSVLYKPVSWFDMHDSGIINNYFTENVNKYKQGVGDKIGMIGQAVITTIGSVVIIFILDWRTSFVVMSLSPMLIVTAAYMTMLSMESSLFEAKTYGKANSVAQQSFTNIRTVHAFNGTDVVESKYNNNLEAAKLKAIKKGLLNATMLGLLWLVMYAASTLGFWYGSIRLDDGVTVGTILIVFFGMQTAVFSIGGNLPHYSAIIDARVAANTIYNIIDKKGSSDASSISTFQALLKPSKPILGSIKFEGVSFSYPSRLDTKILQNVDLEIPRGMTVALVGESGSGKSTIAQLLLKFYDVHEGQITIDNKPINSIDVKFLRSQIGLVSQEPILFSTSISENIRLGKSDATDDEIENVCKIANAHEFINKFTEKYDTQVGESGSQLSGGQKQRIAIARALISNPPILILDEATSALDSESEKYVQKALDVASTGRTTIIIAHRLSTIRNADLIIGMSEGRVIEKGTHEQLMLNDGVYKTLVMAQSKQYSKEDDVFDDIVYNEPPKRQHLISTSSFLNSEVRTIEPSQIPETKTVFLYLMKMNSPEWVFIVLGCATCVAFGVLQIVFEYFFAKILLVFSHCNPEERQRLINRDCLAFLWIGIATGVSQFTSMSSFTFSGEKLTKRLRQNTFKSIVNQEIAYFDNADNSIGKLCTLLSNEASAVQGALGIRIGTTLSGISILLVGVVIAFVVGWQLSLVILTFVPVLILSGIISMKVMAGFDAGDKKYLETAGCVIVDSTSNIRIVKQLGQESYFAKKYNENVQFVCQRNLKRTVITGFLFGFSQGFVFFAIAATYYAGSKFIEQQFMTTEDLMLVFGTLLFGAMAVGQSQAMAPDFGKAVDASKKIYAILNKKPEIDSRSQEGTIPPMFDGKIVLDKIKFNYPSRKEVKVIRNMTMHLNPKENVAIVGTSGCGKSTIIQLLQRFYDPSHGQIYLDGVDIKTLNLSWYRSKLGIVSQEPVLFNWTIEENIAFGDASRKVSIEEIQSAAKAANIDSFIRQLPEGYQTNVGTRGSLISGGQKQRICIARAIIRNPSMLLLDEATSALDAESEKTVQKAINTAQENRASVTIAHRLLTIQNSDVIYVLDEGRIAEKGRHEDLLSQNGLYHDLYQLSMR